jgi:hypothetical protein
MTLKPAIAFWLVRVEIVEDDVNFAAGMVGDDLIHEVEKFSPAAALIVTGLYGATEHIKSRKERRGSVALIAVREAGERLAVGKSNPALRTFERLDRGFLVHAQDQRIFWWIQVKSNNVGGLGGELRVGRYAPAPATLKRNVSLLLDAPDVGGAHVAERLGQKPSRPGGEPYRRRPIQHRKDAFLCLGVVLGGSAGAAGIEQPTIQPISRKARPPFPHGRSARPERRRNILIGLPRACHQNN